MRDGINVLYRLDQKELVEFIKACRQFSHIGIAEINEYCEKEGHLVHELHGDRYVEKSYYNPAMAIEYLAEQYGMTCPLCGNRYGVENPLSHIARYVFDDEAICPYELLILYAEMPEVFSGHRRPVYKKPLCPKCYRKYFSYVHRRGKIEHYVDWEKRPSLVVDFLATQVKTAGRKLKKEAAR